MEKSEYAITYTNEALKQLENIEKKFNKQITDRISNLKKEPRPPGMEALKGNQKGLYRIRQGNYRIIYSVKDAEIIVTIVRVADRKDVYK